MNTLTLQEAARFLKMSAEDLRRKAKIGRIPAAKPGKQWVFIEEDLVSFIRSTYAQDWQISQVPGSKKLGGNTWHCANVAKSGGLISPRQTDSEYDALLAQPTNNKRKSSTTS